MAGQAVQELALVSALNVSAKHAVGVPPFAPVYPAFAMHAVLADDAVAPPVAELVGQAVHATEDRAVALKLPAAQAATSLPWPV